MISHFRQCNQRRKFVNINVRNCWWSVFYKILPLLRLTFELSFSVFVLMKLADGCKIRSVIWVCDHPQIVNRPMKLSMNLCTSYSIKFRISALQGTIIEFKWFRETRWIKSETFSDWNINITVHCFRGSSCELNGDLKEDFVIEVDAFVI